jgi:hypothetical protein
MESNDRGSLKEKFKSNSKDKLLNEYDLNIENKYSPDVADEIIFDKYFFARALLVIIGLSIVILNTVYGFVLPHGDVACLQDTLFEITSGFNNYLKDHSSTRHLIIAISSFCEDFIILYISIHWVFYAKSWRLIVAILSFYIFRGGVQALFAMKYPEGYLWEYPNFPSVTISYLKTSDFFFSGHIGFPIIIALECYNLNKLYMVAFCIFTCFDVAFTMIVTRGHYTIDQSLTISIC